MRISLGAGGAGEAFTGFGTLSTSLLLQEGSLLRSWAAQGSWGKTQLWDFGCCPAPASTLPLTGNWKLKHSSCVGKSSLHP